MQPLTERFGSDHAKALRPHPPRLQHSPSLPNIWFPPHSGPIPPNMEDMVRASMERMSLSQEDESKKKPLAPRGPAEHRETLSFDDASRFTPEPQGKRRNIKGDHHRQSLLTPPLTPSSSLKTTASIDSADAPEFKSESNAVTATSAQVGGKVPTRFLLLSNLPKTLSQEHFQDRLVASLTDHAVCSSGAKSSAQAHALNHGFRPLDKDAVKGFHLRRLHTHGTAVVAFYDLRDAVFGQAIISTLNVQDLTSTDNHDAAEESSKNKIDCQFITADNLAETIGQSTFLTATTGSFFLEVINKTKNDAIRMSENNGSDANEVDGGHGSEVIEERMEPSSHQSSMLERYADLKAHLQFIGELRHFQLIDGESIDRAIFLVEYFDVRCADKAFGRLNSQVILDFELRVYGREARKGTKQTQDRWSGGNSALLHFKPDALHSPSEARATYQDERAPKFGAPGQLSGTRTRFPVTERPRLNSTSNGHDGRHGHSEATSPFSTSPTVFYTSVPPGHPNGRMEHIGNPPSSEGIYPTPFAALPMINTEVPMSHRLSNPLSTEGETAPYYGLRHLGYAARSDCYYCPSHHGPSTCTSPAPMPYLYDPQIPPGAFPVSPIHAYPYGQEVLQTPSLPNRHPVSWPSDQLLIAPSRPVASEQWFAQELPAVFPAQGSPFYTHPVPVAPHADAPYYPPAGAPATALDGMPVGSHPNHEPGSPPASRGQRFKSKTRRESTVPPERNQLNLARIEEGLDTRTTVMVKNIPNKMSDKDLIAFIGQVCPRRIDFLYLRMDFQNGCNVGYAFVNFITVQDLLHFAKAKLGEKWNMFSSEKVLQMSYANYQGKEALVEKFKNSSIMDEIEPWRPKIFYSDGREQGLPEPFPAPTHLKRKERSSHNRGALYGLNVGRGSSGPQGSAYGHRRQREEGLSRAPLDRRQSGHDGQEEANGS